MKFLNGFFWFAMPGIIQGCHHDLDFDCEFVNSCLFTDNITYASTNHHAIGSGRWVTGRQCDGPDNQCMWEKQEEKIGDAFEMSDGTLTIHIEGLYMIDTSLWNNDRDNSITIKLRKNGNDISAG